MDDPELLAGIYEYEMFGVALGVATSIMLFPGRPILLFGDNEGANGTVVRGSGETLLGKAIAAFIWRIASETATPYGRSM